MPWYKSGTVSVVQNSNAVTGINTSFIANARVGDAFLGPDGRWYEVANIASDTALAISPNYLGATAGAGTYALAPMQGYVKDSADALRALVSQFGTKLAELGTTGNYDTLPVNKGGTGATTAAAALAALGGVKLGAANAAAGTNLYSGAPPAIASINSSGNEGSTALRISNGANNAASAVITFIRDGSHAIHFGLDTDNKFKIGGFSMGAVARTLYHEGNAVGTVSQSGGVPTGAIIEEGSNGNGTYIKYLNGTMICRHEIAYSSLPPGAAAAAVWLFPSPFTGQPTCIPAAGSVGGNAGFLNAGQDSAGTGTSTTIAVGNSHSSATIGTPYVHVIAIGRWF